MVRLRSIHARLKLYLFLVVTFFALFSHLVFNVAWSSSKYVRKNDIIVIV